MSQALYLTGGSHAFETAYFIGKINNFFDCLNVPNYTTGIYNRKPFLMPYSEPDDWRLQVNIIVINTTKFLSIWSYILVFKRNFNLFG